MCITGQFDNNEPLHLQMLQTVYKVLTATAIDCPRYGSHWDLIGFQVGVIMVESLFSSFCYFATLFYYFAAFVCFSHRGFKSTNSTGIEGNNFTLHVIDFGT